MGLFERVSRLFRRDNVEPLTGLEPATTRVIVGLGNPGPEYIDTRHNVGFRCVDEVARRSAAGWQDKTTSLAAHVAVTHLGEDVSVVLVKPNTFMNRSGSAVKKVLEFLEVDPENCLIVYDDMDLPFGRIRLRERGSPGTHNGMRSVVGEVGTESIPRLRIGIGQSEPGGATSHVLSEFTDDEREQVKDLIERAGEAALAWAELGANVAMNRYNNS